MVREDVQADGIRGGMGLGRMWDGEGVMPGREVGRDGIGWWMGQETARARKRDRREVMVTVWGEGCGSEKERDRMRDVRLDGMRW